MREKNYQIIILSIIFAILLWFLINMNYDYVTTAEVKINLTNLNNTALKKPIPDSFIIKVKDRGWDLISFKLTTSPEFILDLSNVKTGVWNLTKKEIIEGINFSQKLNILDVSIDSINIHTDTYDSVKLPVRLDVDLNFKEGYGAIGNIEIKPESIVVKGAKSILDTLNYWQTKKVKITNISENINIKIPLTNMPKYVLESNVHQVELKLKVEPFADKTLSGINIQINSLPPNREVIIIPPKLDLIIRGSIKQLAEINPESVTAYIDYAEIISDTTGNIQPRFIIPDGLKLVRHNPEKFQYIIRKRLM